MVESPGIAPPLRLSLLNGFHLTEDGQTRRLPLSAQRVVAFLALRDQRVSREFVAGSLWLDASAERASANLRSALWRLRAWCPSLVNGDRAQLELNHETWVDVREVVTLARRIADRSADWSRQGLPSNLAGELLPDWYDDWIVLERERLRQLRLHALEGLSERLLEAGRFGEAVEVALAAVAEEPLRESAHRAVIRAHLAEGNHGEAIRQYRAYVGAARRELGVGPSPLLEELVAPFPG